MIFAFADLELDVDLYELRKQGHVVKLAPKAYDLLLYLIEHRERVVSKPELLEKLWPGEHVTESVLPSNVNAIRKALQGERSRLIQTVHGRGYRFIAPVEERERDAPPAEPGRTFVGRADVMETLRADLESALRGRERVAMLVGEPGIGKTRTAAELAADARRRGALAAEGHGYEGEGVPAFWPWVQILRALVAELPRESLRQQLGAGAADVATLVPELRETFPELSEATPLESEQARFRLFDSVSTFLQRASRAQPLLLFLDDLHWADEPSLLLLKFAAREVRDAHVLLLGAYRDVELRRQHPLAQVLGELARAPHFRRVPLRGLVVEDVSRFIEGATGRKAPEALVNAVFEMTEGNPFFIDETVRLLAAEGRLDSGQAATPPSLSLPQGVREAIGRRLDRLSEACNQILGLAAVIGREFSVGVLHRTADLPEDAVMELLEEAAEARIVGDQTSARGGRSLPLGHYAFCHALIREALYEELSGPRRVRVHRRVAEVLESIHGATSEERLPELAHHFFQAAPGGDVERAIDYGVRAAEQALDLLAYEEGVSHYERALEAADLVTPADEPRRGELVFGLAQAQWRAGRYPQARHTFLRAIELARRIGDDRLFARAALGLGGWPQFRADEPPGGPADEYHALLREAFERLDERDTSLRAKVVSRLADQLSMEARETYSQRAVALARESGDPDALFLALSSRLTALLGPDDVRRRLDVATELLELAIGSGSREKVFIAREARIRSLLAVGDLAAADREIELSHELAEELRLPIYRHSLSRFRLARALADGRLDETERLNRSIRELGRSSDDSNAELVFELLNAWLAWLREGLAEVRERLEALIDRVAFLGPMPRAFAALVCGASGDLEAARRHFGEVAARDFEDVPRDETWLITMAVLAETCAILGDRERAASLYERLLPYADLLVSHLHMRIYLGPVEYLLGRLQALLGDRDRASAHFERAIETSRRIGARPFLARTQCEYARLLLGGDRATRGARKRAHSLLAEAERTARDLGIAPLAALAGQIRDRS